MKDVEKLILKLIVNHRKEGNILLRNCEEYSEDEHDLSREMRLTKEALTYINSREKELKEVAKNARHKAFDIVNEYFAEEDHPESASISRDLMNIQFEDIKPVK